MIRSIKSALKNKYLWIILAVTILGFFLRVYQHQDLLFFEVDQARDWRIVEIALKNGAGELPLSGPGMNASTFRIGPIYHYIQYASALIFGNTPPALAYPDLIFSVLSIPLFYLFLREYFSKISSSLLTLLFAGSLFAIEYGRFAMNSNSLPFFILLVFYPLLRISREENQLKKWVWTGLFAFSFGIIIQLHALTLFALPIIIFVYLTATKTKIGWKQWLAGILLVLILNSPLVINEIMSGFQSIKGLESGLSLRQESQKNFSLAKRIIKNSQEVARNYILILTSKDVLASLDPDFKPEGGLDMLKRNFESGQGKTTLFLSIFALFFFLWPVYWLLKKLFLLKEKETPKRNFLILFFIWQTVFLLIYLFIIYVPHTRYYLPVIFIPYILLAVYIEKIKQKLGWLSLYSFGLILLAANLWGVEKWFKMLERYDSPDITYSEINEYVQDPFYIVNLKQIKAVNAYIEDIYNQDKKEIFLVAPKQFYARPIRFLLIWEKNIPMRVFSAKTRGKEKNYLLINSIDTPLENINLTYKNFTDDFEIVSQRSFGTIAAYQCKIKDSVVHKPSSDFSFEKITNDSQNSEHLTDKYTWNQFFNYLKTGKK